MLTILTEKLKLCLDKFSVSLCKWKFLKLTKLCGSKDKEFTTRAKKINHSQAFDMATTIINSTDVAVLSTNASVPSKNMLTLRNRVKQSITENNRVYC